MTGRSVSSTFPTKQIIAYLVLCVFLSCVLIAGVLGKQVVLSEPYDDSTPESSKSDATYGGYMCLTFA